MKTELKTAEQHFKEAMEFAIGEPIPQAQFDSCKNEEGFIGAIKAIESHTSERLDHLRQQLEAKRETCEQDELIGLTTAISLIDQLKAETK
jgi:hypothetical protein